MIGSFATLTKVSQLPEKWIITRVYRCQIKKVIIILFPNINQKDGKSEKIINLCNKDMISYYNKVNLTGGKINA